MYKNKTMGVEVCASTRRHLAEWTGAHTQSKHLPLFSTLLSIEDTKIQRRHLHVTNESEQDTHSSLSRRKTPGQQQPQRNDNNHRYCFNEKNLRGRRRVIFCISKGRVFQEEQINAHWLNSTRHQK